MNINKCPSCGAKTEEAWTFCMNCGHKLSDVEDATMVDPNAEVPQKNAGNAVRLQPLVPLSSESGPSNGAVRVKPLVPITPGHGQRLKPLVDANASEKKAAVKPAIKLKPLNNTVVSNVSVGATAVFDDGSDEVNDDSSHITARLVSIRQDANANSEVPEADLADAGSPKATEMPVSVSESEVDNAQCEEVACDSDGVELQQESIGAALVPDDDPDSPTLVFEEALHIKLVRRNTGDAYSCTAPFSIGKGTKATVMVPGNRHISRVHALFTQVDGGVYIQDNDSLNGTFVDECRLEKGGEKQIFSGAVIRLANEEFEFFVD